MYCNNCMKKIDDNSVCCSFCHTPVNEEYAPHLLKPGTVLNNRYLVGDLIGEGGFGITYIGRDLKLDMRIAVKEFYPSGFANRNNTVSNEVTMNYQNEGKYFKTGVENFLREAKSIAKFNTESSIVDVRDFFEENGTAYIIMEYLEGENLSEKLKRDGKFEPEQIFKLFLPMMNTLEKMHRENIIHRDITPENVRILPNGTLKLMDFGSARYYTGMDKKTMSVQLKPGYAPLEQYNKNGNQGPWTDVYGLCATIYKCVTGNTPVDALERVQTDVLKKPSELGARISEPLENIILYGMAIYPENRCQSMSELIKITESSLGNQNIVVGNVFSVPESVNKTKEEDEKYKTMFADTTYGGSFVDENVYTNSFNNPNQSTSVNTQSQINNKADEEYKDAVLTEAKSNMSSDTLEGYTIAKEQLTTISGWKDANEQLVLCDKRIIEIKEKLQKIKSAKAKKKKKFVITMVSIVGSVVLLVGAFVFIINMIIIPNGIISEAQELADQNNYTDAVKKLRELSDDKSKKELTSHGIKWAKEMAEKGKYVCAANLLMQCGLNDETKPLYWEYSRHVPIAGNNDYTIGIKSDGTVLTTEYKNVYFQKKVSSWKDITSVAPESDCSVAGLKSDGTLDVWGDSYIFDVKKWNNIVAVAPGGNVGKCFVIGLKKDGTVVGVPLKYNRYVEKWKDIVAISTNDTYVVGLKSNGTVVDSGESGRRDYKDWKDIVSVSVGGTHTVGLKADGKVVATGDNLFGECNVSDWKDIVAVSAGYNQTVGVKADGTVVVVGNKQYGADWKDVISVYQIYDHTIALKSDGTLLTFGSNQNYVCNVSDWKLW